MRTMRLVLLLMGVATFTTAMAWSQSAVAAERQDIELAVTYSALRSNVLNGSTAWLQGGGIEISDGFRHGLGAVGSFSGFHASNIAPGVNMTMLTTTFGPRITWQLKSKRRMTVFGQGLAGFASGMDSIFPQGTGITPSAMAPAIQAGGGLDWRLSRRVAVRPVKAEWLWTGFPNGKNDLQHNMNLSSGVVVRLF
jgi:hypothetical protein